MTHTTKTPVQQLCDTLHLTAQEVQTLKVDGNSPFPLKISNDFFAQIQPKQPNDPLLKQILPLQIEHQVAKGFSQDPVSDLTFNPTPSLIHKYHGRVLLIASPKCDIHCRYCFRRHFPYSEQSNTRHWQKALAYIQQDKSIHEVILSGGDPMSLTEKSLVSLIQKIEAIPHVKTLRIHSRTPVISPSTAPANTFLEWATQTRLNKVLVVHCNHANELSHQTETLFLRYKVAGFHLLNQSVLLKGVNDQVEALETLSHALFKQGVLPYYLNQLDRVQGAAHFEVTDDTAIKLHTQLRERLPGYLLPKLVQDLQQATYKSPLISSSI